MTGSNRAFKLSFMAQPDAKKFDKAIIGHLKKHAENMLESFFIHTEYEENTICKYIQFTNSTDHQKFLHLIEQLGYAN